MYKRPVIYLSAFKGKTTRRASFQIKNAGTTKDLLTTATNLADGFFQEDVGSWAHLGATASPAGVMTLWRDGITRDDGSWTMTDGGAANLNNIVYSNAYLGSPRRRRRRGSSNFFTGALRDVRLYARNLPGAELMDLFKNTSAAVNRWELDNSGVNTGTTVDKVNLDLNGGAAFLSGGGVVLDGADDFLDLGGEFAFAATDGFTWCAWVRYDEQVEDYGYLLSLAAKYVTHVDPPAPLPAGAAGEEIIIQE